MWCAIALETSSREGSIRVETRRHEPTRRLRYGGSHHGGPCPYRRGGLRCATCQRGRLDAPIFRNSGRRGGPPSGRCGVCSGWRSLPLALHPESLHWQHDDGRVRSEGARDARDLSCNRVACQQRVVAPGRAGPHLCGGVHGVWGCLPSARRPSARVCCMCPRLPGDGRSRPRRRGVGAGVRVMAPR
jgi:hypothetical protein